MPTTQNSNSAEPESLVTETTEKRGFKAYAASLPAWSGWQRIAFRISFIFFVSMAIPNSASWYTDFLALDWTRLHYRDLYDVARFGSGLDFFGRTFFGNPLKGYATWLTTFLVSVAAGLIWTVIDKRRKPEPKEYNRLYYWLRVIVRYRAGIGIIGFGFTKLLPTQMPYPSLGLLNTDFGDFTLQKIYWLSIGIVPWYQVFAGAVEMAAGILLFFRSTTTLGAILLFGALGDIVYVNFAYDGGVHVYSTYFVLLAAFLIANDVPRLYNLLVLERFTVPFNYYPAFTKSWQKYTRYSLKIGVFVIFLGYLFYLQYINFKYDPYKQPATAGVKTLRGNYNVTEFKINNQVIPYSPEDTVRWQWATFENWTSLTFKVNKPQPLDLSNGGGSPMRDVERTFELTGTAGGQRVYHYFADTINHTLYLRDKYNRLGYRDGIGQVSQQGAGKNKSGEKRIGVGGRKNRDDKNWISEQARINIGDENKMIDPRAASTRRDKEFAAKPRKDQRNRLVLNYTTTDGSRVILKGINEKEDSIYVVLDRVERPYVLAKSTLQAGKYE